MIENNKKLRKKMSTVILQKSEYLLKNKHQINTEYIYYSLNCCLLWFFCPSINVSIIRSEKSTYMEFYRFRFLFLCCLF